MAEGFTCEVVEAYRSACEGLDFYGEHEGKRYCVLHLPSKQGDSEAQFREALERKYEKRDYDFTGVYSPNYFKGWEGEKFPSGASFSEATFEGDTYVKDSTFEGDSHFSNATFKGMAQFLLTIFNGDAHFLYTTFNERAEFPGVRFEGTARFHGVTFGGAVNFPGVTFAKEVDFSLVEFREGVLFSGVKTNPQARFVLWYATVANPEQISFRGMYLRPAYFIDVDPQKFDFYDVEWFRLPNGDELTLEAEIEVLGQQRPPLYPGLERTQSLRKLQRACRRLTSNAEENREYPLANEFHYWAMDALRKEPRPRSFGLIPTLYWALSGYGVRARRALGVLLTIALMFAVLYMLVGSSSLQVLPIVGWGQALADAGQAVMYILGVMARLRPEPIPKEMGLFQILVTIEGILGPLQIGLLLLAIRRQVMR